MRLGLQFSEEARFKQAKLVGQHELLCALLTGSLAQLAQIELQTPLVNSQPTEEYMPRCPTQRNS